MKKKSYERERQTDRVDISVTMGSGQDRLGWWHWHWDLEITDDRYSQRRLQGRREWGQSGGKGRLTVALAHFLLVLWEALLARHSLALPFADSLHPLYPALPSCRVPATSWYVVIYFVFVSYLSPLLHLSTTKAKNLCNSSCILTFQLNSQYSANIFCIKEEGSIKIYKVTNCLQPSISIFNPRLTSSLLGELFLPPNRTLTNKAPRCPEGEYYIKDDSTSFQ